MNKENLKTGSQDNEPDTEALPLLKEMQQRINSSTEKWQEPFKEIRRIRKFITGHQNPRGEVGNSVDDTGYRQNQQANIAYSTLQTLLPLLYARDPDLTAKPSPNVGSARWPPGSPREARPTPVRPPRIERQM